jgi:hypothetical protein
MRAVYGQFPLEAKVPLAPGAGLLRDDGKKQRTTTDLLADFLVPGVATAQLTLIEPNFDSAGPQRLTDPQGRRSVVRGVTQKYRVLGVAHA